MKPRITIITLGVDDLDTSLTFYRDGLGLSTQGIIGKEFEHGAVVFFDLQNGVKLALWPRKSIAHDTTIPVQAPSATEFTLAQNVSSQEEVDLVMQQAQQAGATIIKTAQETFYGGMLAISKIQISMSGKSPGILNSCLTKRADGERSPEETLAPSWSPTKVVLFSASLDSRLVARFFAHVDGPFESAHHLARGLLVLAGASNIFIDEFITKAVSEPIYASEAGVGACNACLGIISTF